MIRIAGLNYTIGDFSLQDVTLEIQRGEYFVLLGKPGSGKTLLLECITGLNRISSGTIEIEGRRVEKAEPRDRGIGYVPQDYALFSKKSVEKNIAFALHARGYSRKERRLWSAELAEMLGIQYLLKRSVEGLSGGERQRVALGRALAARPRILLLDEPVSALDDETQEAILMELRRIQRQLGTTTIHVCHNLNEMRAVADRVGILREGRLVQAGTPEEVCQSPADAEVAKLFALGAILTATAKPGDNGTSLEFGGFSLTVEQPAEGDVQVLLRAAGVRLEPLSSPETQTAARIESVLQRDSTVRVDLKVKETIFRAEVPQATARSLPLDEGGQIAVTVPSQAIHVFMCEP